MQYFLDTKETIPEGLGFEHFGAYHFCWIAASVIVLIVCSLIYRRLPSDGRGKMRKTVAGLIVADEIFKMVCLWLGGNYIADYLPFHLCSINILIFAYHALRPNKLLNNYLYVVCIPSIILPLLFPTWTMLPCGNFMHWHSFTVHILLLVYPVMQLAGGDLNPQPRQFPKCVLFLAAMAVPVYFINRWLGTNFMFLMYAEPGTPLEWFVPLGSHLIGFAVLLPLIVLLMTAALKIGRALTAKKKT